MVILGKFSIKKGTKKSKETNERLLQSLHSQHHSSLKMKRVCLFFFFVTDDSTITTSFESGRNTQQNK